MPPEMAMSTDTSKSAERRRKRKQGKADREAQALREQLDRESEGRNDTAIVDKAQPTGPPRSSRKPSHRNPALSACSQYDKLHVILFALKNSPEPTTPPQSKDKQKRQPSNSKLRLKRLVKKKRDREEKARIRQENKEERMRVYAEVGRAPPKKRANPPPPRADV